MSDVYELIAKGAVPVSLDDMKAYMKVTSDADDDLITMMLNAATVWGENYTGREFRANTWALLLDEFSDRICIRRDPVKSITSVEYLVADVFTAVTNITYYLKKNVQNSEILLAEDEDWPADLDSREQGIKITFVTESYRYCSDAIINGIKRHVAWWYANRGDCSDSEDAATQSSVQLVYDQFRISRV